MPLGMLLYHTLRTVKDTAINPHRTRHGRNRFQRDQISGRWPFRVVSKMILSGQSQPAYVRHATGHRSITFNIIMMLLNNIKTYLDKFKLLC